MIESRSEHCQANANGSTSSPGNVEYFQEPGAVRECRLELTSDLCVLGSCLFVDRSCGDVKGDGPRNHTNEHETKHKGNLSLATVSNANSSVLGGLQFLRSHTRFRRSSVGRKASRRPRSFSGRLPFDKDVSGS